MSAAARVMMAEDGFLVTAPDGRSIMFRCHERALDYAAKVLRDQKAAQRRSAEDAGDFELRRVRRGGKPFYEVRSRAGQVVAALSSRSLALRKIETLERRTQTRVKPCLSCNRPFESEGAHNRMCHGCNLRAQAMVWI